MADERNNEKSIFVPRIPGKAEGKYLPAWEFLYTGTLWRLTRGSKTRNIHPNTKSMRSCY